MGKNSILSLCIAFCMVCFATSITAQGDITQFDPDKKDQTEIGINLGAAYVHGDLAGTDNGPKIGLGVGLHLRKAFDHIFSARIDANYLGTKNEAGSNEIKTTWLGLDAMGVITLNNFKIDKGEKKSNVYVGLGAGVDSFKAEPDSEGPTNGTTGLVIEDIEGELGVHAAMAAGIAWKVGKNMSFGIEHKVHVPFGRRADYLDGGKLIARSSGDRDFTQNNDLMHFTNINLNFHLGKDDKAAPLYWVSPLTYIYKDVAEVKARPKLDLTDTDGDGVIDMLDQEKDTPAGAPVDTRGFALDSDGDGLADHEDKEPYSAPGYDIDREGVAQIPPPPAGLSEDDVIRIGKAQGWGAASKAAPGLADWFLPIIHFNFDRYDIKDTEVEKLYQVATVMQKNPGLQVVAHGHTDKVASNRYNNVLSYNRAAAAIDYIVTKFGIDRSRFVLNWGGEDSTMVPSSGRNMVNRRVEFRVANGESEMARPEGPNAGKGSSFSGNRDAGY